MWNVRHGLAALLVILGACAPQHLGDGDGTDAGVDVEFQAAPLIAAPIDAEADTTLRLAVPFGNDGTGSLLGVSSASVADLERSLIRFDTADMQAAVGGNVLHRAEIELTAVTIPVGWAGGRIQILPMAHDWPEGTGLAGHGPSWVCANDTNTTLLGNLTDDCSTVDEWGMLPTDPRTLAFTPDATDSVALFTGAPRTMRFDVTKDVQRYLNGAQNDGWMLKGQASIWSGQLVNFESRESGNGPQLLIEMGHDECPLDPDKGVAGACGCGTPDRDTNDDGVADCYEAVVAATADTTIRQVTPFANDGTGQLLGVTSASIASLERGLVRFDTAAIQAALGGTEITEAYVELSIAGMSLDWLGGAVELHEMTVDWPEGTGTVWGGHGPSWVCPDDRNTSWFGNLFNNCPWGQSWGMQPWDFAPRPYEATPTASRGLQTFGTGTLRFNVTDDVQAYLDGTRVNRGWIVMGSVDLLSGEYVNFGSRESGAPPKLLIRYDECAGDPNKSTPGECGCFIPDTDRDNDGTPDCKDRCKDDPLKTDPGFGKCGTPDNDADGDGVPDAIDDAPNDPTQQVEGSCGTAANPTPAGTACDDGACCGVFTCDGAGHCGDANCPPAGGGQCEFRQFLGSDYWFCDGASTWAEAASTCRLQEGRRLVEVNSALENLFVAVVASGQSWTGANDTNGDDIWRWARHGDDGGDRLWTGDADGEAYFGAFTGWTSSSPGTGEDCGAVSDADGTWEALPCGSLRGFVCEVETGGYCDEFVPTGPSCLAEARGGSCRGTDEPCVEESTVFPGYDLSTEAARDAATVQAEQDRDDCHAFCSDSNNTEQECRDHCQGFAQAPADTGALCEPWRAEDRLDCGLAGAISGSEDVSCIDDADCAAVYGGYSCGLYQIGDTGPVSRMCGIRNTSCPPVPDPDANLNCEEPALICADDDKQQTVTDWADPSGLDPVDFDPNTHFPEPDPLPDVPYTAGTQTPCNGDCNRGQGHPWCKYASDQALDKPADVIDDRAADTGDQPLVSFVFDPALNLDFDAKIGPLGLPKPELTAEAGLKAEIIVSDAILPSEQTLSIVNVRGAVDGSRCGVDTSRTVVQLLNMDFVPGDGPPGEVALNSEECEEAFALVEEAANRANKAMRDARAMLEQYYERAQSNNALGNLCLDIARPGEIPEGFPPLPLDGTTTCANEAPEKTLGRFIEYYRRQVQGFPDPSVPSIHSAAAQLNTYTEGLLQAGDEIELFGLHGDEEETIVEVQFFIGPIPANLEVYSALNYGVTVDAVYRMNAGSFVEGALSPGPTPQTEVAFFGVDGKPYANAFVGVFAGVGFSFGPVAAKLGIEAELSLAKITLPLTAGAGIGLGTLVDDRDAPDDLGDPLLTAIVGQHYLLPPKQYQARVRYALELRAEITDILSGSVNARLKIKFFWFSKSWRKELYAWTGFCPPGQCNYRLFAADGSVELPKSAAWGGVRMPSPFPALIEPGFLLGQTVTPGTANLEMGQIEELFFDSLCTCSATDDEEEGCFRDQDCCDFDHPSDSVAATCFSDPEPGGVQACRTCRVGGASCNDASDCCQANVQCFEVNNAGYKTCSVPIE